MVMACPFTSAATSAGGECLQEARYSAAAPAARTTKRRFIGVSLYCSPEEGRWDRPACPKARFLRRVVGALWARVCPGVSPRGEPGDRRDCQRISGKRRRKSMAVSSVPYSHHSALE